MKMRDLLTIWSSSLTCFGEEGPKLVLAPTYCFTFPAVEGSSPPDLSPQWRTGSLQWSFGASRPDKAVSSQTIISVLLYCTAFSFKNCIILQLHCTVFLPKIVMYRITLYSSALPLIWAICYTMRSMAGKKHAKTFNSNSMASNNVSWYKLLPLRFIEVWNAKLWNLIFSALVCSIYYHVCYVKYSRFMQPH